MPGSELPTYRTPSPDAGHEAIRAPLARAIDDLADAALGVEDAYFLTGMLLTLVDSLLAQAGEMPAEHSALGIRIDAVKINADTALGGVDVLQEAMADLTARVAALEDAEPAPLTGPDAAG